MHLLHYFYLLKVVGKNRYTCTCLYQQSWPAGSLRRGNLDSDRKLLGVTTLSEQRRSPYDELQGSGGANTLCIRGVVILKSHVFICHYAQGLCKNNIRITLLNKPDTTHAAQPSQHATVQTTEYCSQKAEPSLLPRGSSLCDCSVFL